MQIHLNQTEIEAAINDYLLASGIDSLGKTVTMSFSQKRQPTEFVVEIDISSPELKEVEEKAPQPVAARTRKPSIQKAEKPKEEAPVVTSDETDTLLKEVEAAMAEQGESACEPSVVEAEPDAKTASNVSLFG